MKPLPKSPSDAFERAYEDAAVRVFADVHGRKPLQHELASLRKNVAKKFMDRIGEWSGDVDRAEVEKIAAASLGGPFEEP